MSDLNYSTIVLGLERDGCERELMRGDQLTIPNILRHHKAHTIALYRLVVHYCRDERITFDDAVCTFVPASLLDVFADAWLEDDRDRVRQDDRTRRQVIAALRDEADLITGAREEADQDTVKAGTTPDDVPFDPTF